MIIVASELSVPFLLDLVDPLSQPRVIALDADDVVAHVDLLALDLADVLRVLVNRVLHDLRVLLDVRQLQLHLHLDHLVQGTACRWLIGSGALQGAS